MNRPTHAASISLKASAFAQEHIGYTLDDFNKRFARHLSAPLSRSSAIAVNRLLWITAFESFKAGAALLPEPLPSERHNEGCSKQQKES
jgi:hypothetical protein